MDYFQHCNRDAFFLSGWLRNPSNKQLDVQFIELFHHLLTYNQDHHDISHGTNWSYCYMQHMDNKLSQCVKGQELHYKSLQIRCPFRLKFFLWCGNKYLHRLESCQVHLHLHQNKVFFHRFLWVQSTSGLWEIDLIRVYNWLIFASKLLKNGQCQSKEKVIGQVSIID